MGSNTLFWPQWVMHACGTQMHAYTHRHTPFKTSRKHLLLLFYCYLSFPQRCLGKSLSPKSSHMLGKSSINEMYLSPFLHFLFFWDRVSLKLLSRPHWPQMHQNPLASASSSARIKGTHHHTQFFWCLFFFSAPTGVFFFK